MEKNPTSIFKIGGIFAEQIWSKVEKKKTEEKKKRERKTTQKKRKREKNKQTKKREKEKNKNINRKEEKVWKALPQTFYN